MTHRNHFVLYSILLVFITASVAIIDIPQDALAVFNSVKTLREFGAAKDKRVDAFEVDPLEVPDTELNNKASDAAKEMLADDTTLRLLQPWKVIREDNLVIIRHAVDPVKEIPKCKHQITIYDATWNALQSVDDNKIAIADAWEYNRMGAHFQTIRNEDDHTAISILIIVLKIDKIAFENYFRMYTCSLLGRLPEAKFSSDNMPLNAFAKDYLETHVKVKDSQVKFDLITPKKILTSMPQVEKVTYEHRQLHAITIKVKVEDAVQIRGILHSECRALLDRLARHWKKPLQEELVDFGFAFDHNDQNHERLAVIIFQLSGSKAASVETSTYFYGIKHPLSQFYLCTIIATVKQVSTESMEFQPADTQVFICAEQWMMYMKALLFNDTENAYKIKSCTIPREMARYGKVVKNFAQDLWDLYKDRIVWAGSFLKYKDNKGQSHPHMPSENTEKLWQFLLATEGALVEANPTDKYYGIGLRATDLRAFDPETFNGSNTLGKTLTKLRIKYQEAPKNGGVEQLEQDLMNKVHLLIQEIHTIQEMRATFAKPKAVGLK